MCLGSRRGGQRRADLNEADAGGDPLDLAPADLEDLEAPDPNPEPVSYSGSDFDVEGLVRRLKRGDIVIPTFGSDDDLDTAGFQRRFVWNRSQMDRFIESLLLGYPIPGIFLVQQVDKRYLVLDGQQRLKTLEAFYEGYPRRQGVRPGQCRGELRRSHLPHAARGTATHARQHLHPSDHRPDRRLVCVPRLRLPDLRAPQCGRHATDRARDPCRAVLQVRASSS